MKKMFLALAAGVAFTTVFSFNSESASAQEITTNDVNVVGSLAENNTAEKDFWSDLVDGITGNNKADARHVPPPPHHHYNPPHHHGPHHNPPPPPHHGPHHAPNHGPHHPVGHGPGPRW